MTLDCKPIPKRPSIAYIIEARFPGGTSSAVAAELEALQCIAHVVVHALSTGMFDDQPVAPQVRDALRRLDIPLIWDAPEIAADVVVFHNPACLKFDHELKTRIIARQLIVITHENFLRPGGALAFDVEKCLSLIASSSICLKRSLAPISPANRSVVESWHRSSPSAHKWSLLAVDWFNICAFEMGRPTAAPKDRRGRHSRPGPEKFPDLETLHLCFPKHADCNVLLGADSLMLDRGVPPHWTLYPFNGLSLESYFASIDFMVYFTARTWRDSFGRVIAEAIAAGKIVITDPETAHTFHGAAIGAAPRDVDGIIAGYIADPARYETDVLAGQAQLDRFSADAFRAMFATVIDRSAEQAA